MRISSVVQMRAMDRKAIDAFGIPDQILMENAGRAAFGVLSREWGVARKRYVIFCGVGNNAGDGLVVCRHILSNGGFPMVFFVGDPERLKGAARKNLEIVSKLSVKMDRVTNADEIEDVVSGADGIVDAIFGTGLDRDVAGVFREVIELINKNGKPVLSLDIPSGINGDTGAVLGAAVKADHTVTFGLPKRGNMLYPGYGLCGALHVTHISFPPSLYNDETMNIETNDDIPLPERKADAHKGSVGDVLFIAGASGYYGAPFFSAMAFLKAGGGYSRLAAPKTIAPFLAANGSEIVFVPQTETEEGSISLKNKESLLALSEKVDMVVIGPGLSLQEETGRLVRELVASIGKPLLIDGDGITAVAGHADAVVKRSTPTVLTPHPGEMSRLSGKSVQEIENDRITILQETCGRLNAYIVLKGAHSLIGTPDGRVFINMTGNPGMATAGVGDVLTGAIAAMFGQGLPFEKAVRKGVFLHGLAGDLAAADHGQDGITARDVLNCLPEALKRNREKFAGALNGQNEFFDMV
jgi:ADP-dependent NAD(P)H-hydrate dehydratase / NAD(P)H-hydrate epimerase